MTHSHSSAPNVHPQTPIVLTSEQLDSLLARAVQAALAAAAEQPPVERLLSAGEAAQRLGVATATVRRWYREEGLPGYRRGERGHLHYRAAELDAWHRQHLGVTS